ncbi:G-protein coupled receptor seb-2 [Halotydeus destructor]|nr:G-protein coupled receptor seb-2 [Halotydeus destructor]
MSTGGIGCRTETGIELPFHLYALDTCAKCYFYMPTWAFTDRLSYTGLGQLQDPWTNVTYMANDTAELEKSFVSPMMILKWKQCCEDAIGCCLNQLSVKDKATGGCPRTWDGWTCWPDNLAVGGVSSQACPRHIYWRMAVPPCRGYATKTCTSDGQWYSIENREWTNYTNCARDDIYLRRLRYSIATHLISIAIIIPALFIFNYYRQLSATPRIRLHKHLFACLLLYATLSALLKFYLLETETELSNAHSEANYDDNSTAYCLALSLALRYFRSATYLWMFNEAFYLHRLIKKAFSHPSVTPLIFFAYGLSFLTTLSYIICRSLVSISDGELDVTMSKHDLVAASLASDESYSGQDGCWLLPANEPWKEWVINGPNLCILLVNCLLLWPIIMEIYKKANSGPSPSPHSHPQRNLIKQNSGQAIMTKANFMVPLRAATLLLPLYGLHFLLIVYRPDIE